MSKGLWEALDETEDAINQLTEGWSNGERLFFLGLLISQICQSMYRLAKED